MADMEDYKELFVVESRESNETIAQAILNLEECNDRETIDEIFRSAHTIKGASASMGFMNLEKLCHTMEDVFDLIRNDKIVVSAPLIDVLLGCTDEIEDLLDSIEGGGTDQGENIEDLVTALENCKASGDRDDPPGAGAPETEEDGSGDPEDGEDPGDEPSAGEASGNGARYRVTVSIVSGSSMKDVRAMIALSNLDEIGTIISTTPSVEAIEDGQFEDSFETIIESEVGTEAIQAAVSGTDIAGVEVAPADAPPAPPKKKEKKETKKQKSDHRGKTREIKNIRVDIHLLDQMMNLVEDLVINRGRLKQIAQKHQIKEFDEALSMVGRSVADLQNLMMHIRMIPLSHIFNRLPRVVRDVAQQEEKEVDFIIEGGETELDRSVMDGLNDPLLHLIRNAVDHGIELPEDRKAAGKPEKGVLRLSAKRDRDNVVIRIEDDGAGVDVERVRAKAVSRGLYSEEDAASLSEEQVVDLLFSPGFSTAETITDISGRGVGLDVVKAAIESMKGSINVRSVEGKGTCFELVLPPTMAIVEVMMVRINGRRCAIPISNVVEVAILKTEAVHRVGTSQVILLRDEVLPIHLLDDMFGGSNHGEVLVVLQNSSKKCGIVADVVEGQQEVVVKPLSTLIGSCPGVGGVTIPGDGEVVPVLDVNTMI
ncbi:two-component system chemotaxis sensor kinase CheA [Methanofollis sp. W23]|uniref:chemotaxis protein CheA n=1 Tax=Methanofollis sp. W23 TaxID=2817849 RepID=UPI001AE61A0A|nr:chemotaxis protein CheA [Methanofollis sp. W23]MBP2145188.1 two-component system chemotaxis sensor kinase CheA [Methanofollis sp. W23]